MHYLHNNVLVIDQSEYIEDRPVSGPFPAFPMTKKEKPWERGCIAKTIDRDGGVGSMKKLGGRGHRFEGHFWNEKGT